MGSLASAGVSPARRSPSLSSSEEPRARREDAASPHSLRSPRLPPATLLCGPGGGAASPESLSEESLSSPPKCFLRFFLCTRAACSAVRPSASTEPRNAANEGGDDDDDDDDDNAAANAGAAGSSLSLSLSLSLLAGRFEPSRSTGRPFGALGAAGGESLSLSTSTGSGRANGGASLLVPCTGCRGVSTVCSLNNLC